MVDEAEIVDPWHFDVRDILWRKGEPGEPFILVGDFPHVARMCTDIPRMYPTMVQLDQKGTVHIKLANRRAIYQVVAFTFTGFMVMNIQSQSNNI